MPVRCTCSRRSGIFNNTFTSAVTFTAASQPSRSCEGSVSAMPIACARLTASSSERPFHFGKDNIGGGVENAGEAAEFGCRKTKRKQREDGYAIHDRGFEEKLP